ncbi:hypothetical protein OE88DRAFT_1737288 [Heliocybe sulcata]|uniref:SANT domain-containing protein n=1 Tax=Heliocybe sulcata TaxID=5364 RepID=A0A5C3N5R5_9AGAM|nr:hypothetical protein OE88DRAFT_1737288 [Heliocybe sulcata]
MAVEDHRTRLPDYHSPATAVNSVPQKDNVTTQPPTTGHISQPRAGPATGTSVLTPANNVPMPPPKQEAQDITMSDIRPQDTGATQTPKIKSGRTHEVVQDMTSRTSSAQTAEESTIAKFSRDQSRTAGSAEQPVDTGRVSGTDGDTPMANEQRSTVPDQSVPISVPSGAGGRHSGAAETSGMDISDGPPDQRVVQEDAAAVRERKLRPSAVLARSSETMEIKSLKDALCRVVQVRRVPDLVSREQRIGSILSCNIAIAPPEAPPPNCSPEEYVHEIVHGTPGASRIAKHCELRSGFITHLANRQAVMLEHTEELRKKYLELHAIWKVKCAEKDKERAKPVPVGEGPSASGRTTRRSAATMGDAVRSDLEMEQIIASLGNEDLTDATSLAARNTARIPDMISVTHGPIAFVFDDTNNRVAEPQKFYAPRTGLYDWTEEEKQTFCETFAAFPKQFGIIADFLPNKTPSQCVAYYYLHKKSQIDFRKVVAQYGMNKRRRGGKRAADKQKGNALLTDIRRHDAEVSADHGGASTNGITTRGRRGGRLGRPPRRDLDDTPTPTPTPDPEPRTRPRRNRVASRYAHNPDRGSDDDDDGTESEPKVSRKGRKPKKSKSSLAKEQSEDAQSHTSGETKFIDQMDLTVRRKLTSHANWTENDKELFLRLLAQYGDDFKRIAASMPHKTTIQVTAFYKSNLDALRLDQVAARAPKRSPTPNSMMDNWQDMHRPYPSSTSMSPARHDGPSSSRQHGAPDASAPRHQYAQPTADHSTSSQSKASSSKTTQSRPSQPTPPPIIAPPPPGSQQVLDLRNGIIVDQRSTWFSAGSNVTGAQASAGPLDPAGHFSGTVDLGLRMYQGIQPQVQYRPMGGPLPSLNVVLPGQGLRFGFTPEYNTYGRLPYQRSVPLGAADPSHAPLPNRQDERLFGGQAQNANSYNAFSAPSLPDHYTSGHWPTS